MTIDESRPASRRLRVVHVLHSFGTGGLEKGIAAVVSRSSPGFEHCVLCLGRAGASVRLLPPGTPVVELHKPAGNSLRFLLRLSGALRDLRPDVVHTRNWGGMDGVLAARLAGVRNVVHGEHGWEIADPEGKSLKRIRVRRFLSRWVREYTCVSRAIEVWLHEAVRVRGPVTQIYNGVDTDVFRTGDGSRVRAALGVPADAFVVGVVGRLDPIKDHATLLGAFGEVRGAYPHARLLVVGDGPERAGLESEAGEGVTFLGDRQDVPELLRALDVFVLPSRNEGISNTILEAMAAGLPVVATAVGGNPELVVGGETGALVPPGDVGALAGALGAHAASADLRRARGEAGRRRVSEGFSTDRMVSGYETVYRRVALRGA